MKILYDYQAFHMQRFGGVSNCFVQLIKRLPANMDYEIAVKESDNIHLRESGLAHVEHCRFVEEKFLSKNNFKGRSFLFRQFLRFFPMQTSWGINRQCSITALQRGAFDIFHPTFFDNYFLPYLNGKPFVLTVHDLIPEIFWGENKQDIQIRNRPLLCREAAHIIAVSEKTKQDLMDILHIPERKITVIYHGAPNNIDVLGEKPIITEKYILFVGNRRLYKYFDEMLLALVDVFKHHEELKLVCTGKPFNEKELTMVRNLGLSDQIIQFYPNNSELTNLYAHALCFIYPSIYEGFGIPILEAYQAKCPVLLNHKSCFPEIAQDAAIYFHLDKDQSDLTEVMEQFLSMTDDKRIELIERQNKRLKEFSWESSALKLAKVYENCMI